MVSLLDSSERPGPATIATLTTIALIALANHILSPPRTHILESPLKTILPSLTPEEIENLDYPPDILPGARDVETPHGSIRVYEWGPEDGPRVLFIHGISTPCVILRKLADPLVANGHRVILFDLFGRGYSDTPSALPHDAALYVTQCMYALLSSPVSWTGNGGVNVVGYSLGGGIAAHFAATFPGLVGRLVLLAPAGMIRKESFGIITRAVFTSGILPEGILAWLTGRRLQTPIAASVKKGHVIVETDSREEDEDEEDEEETTPQISESFIDLAASEVQPVKLEQEVALEVRMRRYITWMVKNHLGFVPAFMSCIRFAPLIGQDEVYRKLGRREKGTTTVLLAKQDEIILPDLFKKDAVPLLGGPGHVNMKMLRGGHDFVVTRAPAIVKELQKAFA